MSRFLPPFIIALLTVFNCYSQVNSWASNWSVKDPFEKKVFIENNEGQFDCGKDNKNAKIYFSAKVTGLDIYFSSVGVIYRHDNVISNGEEPEKQAEQRIEKAKVEPQFFSEIWKGANTDVEVIAEEQETGYCTYTLNNHTVLAHTFRKILYRNIYKGIDIEYFFPNDKKGIEYSVILHPGADLSQVKLIYSNAKEIKQDIKGDIVIQSAFGEFIDHVPGRSYCMEDGNNTKSFFVLRGNEVSFNAGNYDHSKTLIIDPWVMNPAFTGYNSAYDVDYDFQGNVYVYGGLPPYQLQKYNSIGTWQWSYTTILGGVSSTETWVGDFTVDHRSGISYLVCGLGTGGGADAIKVSTAGILQAADTTLTAVSDELWKVKFDYCNELLVIGGGLLGEAFTMDTNLKSIRSVNVLGTAPEEHDMCLLALDQTGNAYMATDKTSFGPGGWDNLMLRAPLPLLAPVLYKVPDGYSFAELLTPKYYPSQPNGGYDYGNAFNGMAADKKILVTYDGATLKKWAPLTGGLEGFASVSATPILWGGLDINCADNIYLGNNKVVDIYDSSLTLISTIPQSDTIFDVKLGNNNVYACGVGFLSSTQYSSDTLKILKASAPPSSCSACDGKATAYVKGCNADSTGYTYLWSNGQTTSTATGLCYGTYSVTISINCMVQLKDTVNFPGSNTGGMSLAITQTNVSCANTNNGTASVSVTGGTPAYTYVWQPGGSTNASISGLTAGTYSLVVTDKNGDCISGIVVIAQPTVIKVMMASLKNQTCPGNYDGSASVNASGGTMPYTYKWSPSGGVAATATGLSAGVYTIMVTDVNGCTGKDTINIGRPYDSITMKTTNASCSTNNGTAKVTISNGLGFYLYNWSTSASGVDSISNLGPGTYYVTVKDSNSGCVVTDTFKILQSAGPVVKTSQVNNICFGASNGSATVTASGGTGKFTYSWSTGNTSTSVSNLASGTYTVTVTDSAGCSGTASVTITAPAQLVGYANVVNVSCRGRDDGSATAFATGGSGVYTYSWSPSGSTNTTISNLSAGTYTLTVTDSSACTVSDIINITVQPLGFVMTGADSICIGKSTVLSVVGATTYEWSNGSTTSSISVSPASYTTYSVVVTDGSGCKDTLTESVAVNAYPVIYVCCDTSIYLGQSVRLIALSGGSYIWSPDYYLTCDTCFSTVASPPETTWYTVTVTSGSGCSSVDSVLVKVKYCGQVFVPDAFSPNGDGQNDVLYVRGACIKTIDFAIYD
ncbi:MAG TPA: hypothetical protein VNZ45_17400, partial [Bacteroidia bacterium]|nr:hypothetical protein [Bacteroidia bacterium]